MTPRARSAAVMFLTWLVPVLPAMRHSAAGDAPGGAPVRIHHRVHARPRGAQVQRVQPQFGELRIGLGDAVDGAHQPGLDLEPRGEPRRHHCQLQRRGQHIALSDRGVDGIAHLPFLAIARLLPGAVGGDAFGDGGHGQVVLDPDPQPARHLGDAVDADALREFVIEHVAGMGQAAHRIDRAVPAPAPAVEPAAGKLDVARAEKPRAGVDDARFSPASSVTILKVDPGDRRPARSWSASGRWSWFISAR